MPDVVSVLRQEIARVARKEIKAEIGVLKRASAQYRRDVADLKRRVAELERKVDFLQKTAVSDARSRVSEADAENVRYASRWLRAHREKLQLSAEDYGKLIGVTGQTIYSWEQDKSRPRKAQIAAIAAVRKLGRREALARLEVLDKQR